MVVQHAAYHRTEIDVIEALENPEDGGLAAAAGTDESQRLFGTQHQVQFVQHALAHVASVVKRHVPEFQPPT